jgi:hypothetical protein
MSGKQSAHRLREARPHLEVLLMSGYSEEQAVRRGMVEEDVPLMENVRIVLRGVSVLDRA